MARVLFINPSTRNLGTLLTVLPPIGILYLASALREAGHEVRMVDADINDMGTREIAEVVSDYKPDVAGITMNTLQASQAYETANIIKNVNSEILVVAGGPHPSALKGDILRECRSIDAAVFGEGEVTIQELVKAWEGGRSLTGLKGVCFREEGVVVNGPREPIQNLDDLPWPALDLAGPVRRYPGAYPVGARPSIQVMASRGCPFHCTFCSNPVWERRLRLRSPDSVLEEVEWLRREFKVREVFFQDDTFNMDREWFESICQGIIERGLNERMLFKSPFRANEHLVDLELLRLAKRAGFWMIFYGVESGDQAILDGVKKNLRLEEIDRAFRLTRRAGLRSYASFMIGNLGESRATVQNTIAFARRIDPDYYGFAIATPYPGSEFYERAKEMGYLESKQEYKLDRYMLNNESFAPGEVEELVKEAYQAMDKHRTSLLYRLRNIFQRHSPPAEPDRLVAIHTPDVDILDREIVMGENDWDVLGPGWYAVENWPPKVRWTGKRAMAYLRAPRPSEHLFIKVASGHTGFSISCNNLSVCSCQMMPEEWVEVDIPLKDITDDEALVIGIEVDKTWVPDDIIKNGDKRELGVAVERIWLGCPN
ncbi:MAG TPA: radical SAM protein [Methanothrix sp.]|nr:radical SAM protein [Methanothrix sp.]